MKMQITSIVLVAALLSGCLQTRFNETTVDMDGASSTTEYAASAIVPPFSRLLPTNNQFAYRWGGTENKITVGLESEGIDATPQIQALAVTFEALIAIAPLIAPILEVLKAQAPPLTPVEP